MSGKLIFLRATKNLKMFYFTCPTGGVIKKQGYTTDWFFVIQVLTERYFQANFSLIKQVIELM